MGFIAQVAARVGVATSGISVLLVSVTMQVLPADVAGTHAVERLDIVQCIVEFALELPVLLTFNWSNVIVHPVIGSCDPIAVAKSVQRVARSGSIIEALRDAAEIIRRTTSFR